jgi:polysaccharide biosynthesis protein VpsM
MLMRRAVSVWAVIVLLGLVGLSGPAAAQGNIQLGPFHILTSLETALEYDDNILLTADNKIDDLIWIISPGILIELPSKRYAVRLGYRADILEYTDNTQFNTVHHNALFDAQYNFPWNLSLRLSDRFIITDDFAGFPVPEQTVLTKRTENTLDTGGNYTLRERYSFDANFRWYLVRYDEAQFQNNDRDDYTVTGTFFYRILPKTSLLGAIDYVWIRYDQGASADLNDSEGLRFWLGVKGDLTAKTTVLVKAGWEWKYYDNPIQRDWDGLVVEGNIIWKYRDPSEVRLFGGRANVESTFQGQPYYVTNYGGVEVRHYIGERLILRVRGLGGFNDYPYNTVTATQVAKRSDTFIEVGASVRYQMRKWLAFELGYNFLDLNSNFDEFDYTDNRVKASVILTY